MRKQVIGILVALTTLAFGCVEEQDDNIPAGGPPAISGGTLEVAEVDGHYIAVASDPARASVYVVDVSDNTERFRVVLNENDEPGRVAIDDSGRAHVAARRSGDVISIDLRTGEILERRPACAAPRGIDIDPDDGNDLWVACAEGIVVRMPQAGGGVTETVKIAPDLRDVVAQPGNRLYVSRFRSAEIVVWEDGAVADTYNAPDVDASRDSSGRDLSSTVAWRMRDIGDGEVLLVHQQSQSNQLGVLAMPSAGAQYYGGSCDLGVVRSVVSIFNPDNADEPFRSQPVPNATLAVDGDVAGSSIAIAAAAEPGTPRDSTSGSGINFNGVRSVWTNGMTSGFGVGCSGSAAEHFDRPQAATAVATLPDDTVIAYYRDPAEIVVGRILNSDSGFGFGGSTGIEADEVNGTIALSGGRVENAGHALMHEAAGSGTACASCHPEGGDDGHLWSFDTGLRRTQTMNGGILDTAPFHWGGDVQDMTAVMDGTFVNRMGGTTPREDELRSFEQWVDALPAVPGIVEDAAQVERGHQVFLAQGCNSCHSGEKLTNNDMAQPAQNELEDPRVRLSAVAVPSLYEIIYRAPYFHNGAAETLEELVPMHHGADLDDAQRDDLIAYLRSL